MKKEYNETALEYFHENWLKGLPVPKDALEQMEEAGLLTKGSSIVSLDSGISKPNPYIINPSQADSGREDVRGAGSIQFSRLDESYSYDGVTRDNFEKLFDYAPFKNSGKEILKKDWLPESTVYHKDDFYNWVNSITFDGFQNRIDYNKFNLYRQQAYQWLCEYDYESNYRSQRDKNEFRQREFNRKKANSLYSANKMLYMQDGSIGDGIVPFIAEAAQEIVLYLLDSNYSGVATKGRQIGFSTIFGFWGANKISHYKNYFLKYIAIDEEKTEEIFNDKIKYAYSNFDDMYRFYTDDDGKIKDLAINNRDNLLRLGKKTSKGDISGQNSRIKVEAPTVYAINGGSPQAAFVDEAMAIPILSRMLKEQRPTMFAKDPRTGRMEIKRMLWMFSTGGVEDRSQKIFEAEVMSIIKRWKKKDFGGGMIPLFFDWTARPGITPRIYLNEMEEYYSKEGPEAESSRVQFHQHYPQSLEDVFLSSNATLLSIKYITERLNTCWSLDESIKPEVGYFEPVFDISSPNPEGSYLPYKITGAKFVKSDDAVMDPSKKCVTIFLHPENTWRYRYYAGTDPTHSVNATSEMSTSVWDEFYKTLAATVSVDHIDYKERFLQCALMSLYYHHDGAPCPELVEKNIGTAYCGFKESIMLDSNLILTSELPDLYRSSTDKHGYGIDKKRGEKKKNIINAMYELYSVYGPRIFIAKFWYQHKTFVKKITRSGEESYGPANGELYRDDALDSSTFSYICRKCFPGVEPIETSSEDSTRLASSGSLSRFYYDENYNLRVI